MFVISVKMTKRRMLGALGVLGAAALWALLLLGGMAGRAVMDVGLQPVVEVQAATNEDRIEFLKAYGWEVSPEPVETAEVTLPAEFGAVLKQYNELQHRQNLDLARYRGKTVTRYTYEVLNYGGTEKILANLLVYEDTIIGGDICSAAFNGFMHGFDRPEGERT